MKKKPIPWVKKDIMKMNGELRHPVTSSANKYKPGKLKEIYWKCCLKEWPTS